MALRGHPGACFSLEGVAGLAPEEASYSYPWPQPAWRRRLDFHRGHRPLAALLRSFLSATAPDLVHVQNWAVFRSTVFPVLRESRLPIVMTVHDFTLLDPNPFGLPRQGWIGPLRRWLDSRSLRLARTLVFAAVDRFLCPSQTLREGIPFPLGTTRFLRPPIASASLVDPPLTPPLRLLFAGSLYRSKGVDLLLDALATGAPEGHLEIAGCGDQEDALRRQATALGLADRVHFLGHLDPLGMEAAFARAHLVVLPSRVAENSPLVLLEAGARGIPAVASHAGGCPELLAPPARGWTFPPADASALARILAEVGAAPDERRRRGLAMRDWVRRECDPATHWDAVEAVYREITA